MYKAIIVDDEPWTIIDIEKHFAWKIWDLKSSVLTGLRRKLSLLLFQKNQTSSLPTSVCLV